MIAIGADHGGYKLKEEIKKYLDEKEIPYKDFGTYSEERVDYPIYGFILGEKVSKKEVDYGIAICGSAIGISIACNKVKGVRCGKINTTKEAIHAKENDFVNIIALSGSTSEEVNKKIIDAFLEANENKRDPVYKKRISQIERYEKTNEY